MGEYENHATTLVGDVDCTAEEGKALCEEMGVRGYPTLKHGDPANLQDYEGGREYDDIAKFAAELKPSCSPAKRDLCDEADLAAIVELEALDLDVLAKDVKTGDKQIKSAESKYKRQVESLQKKYERYTKSKDKKIKKIKDGGLGLKKSVLAYRKKQAKAKEE